MASYHVAFRRLTSDVFSHKTFSIFQIFLLITQSLASPVWMPQFLSGGTGRNIRHLPCVSRRTGEQGTCMFAFTCMKANGTHLGTCIDRFYFGSCCKLNEDQDPLLENDLNYPLLNNNKVSETDPLLNPSVSTIIDAVKLGSSNILTSTTVEPTPIKPSTTTDKVYVPISTSSSKPNKTEIEIKKPVSTEQVPTTTQQYFLSTFQMVHDNQPTTSTPTTSKTTSKPVATTIKQETKTTTEKTTPKVTTTTTKRPTKPPVKTTTTKKPPSKKPTSKPTTKPTTTSKPTKITSKPTTTKKPTTTTKKPSSTVVYKPVSTITSKPTSTFKPTKKPSTFKPTSTSVTPSPTIALLSTTSEIVFTKPGTIPTTENASSSQFQTFRPDLSVTTKPSLITGPGLSTFSYLSEKVTPDTSTSSISNDIVTEKTSTSSTNVETAEEQSNVIFEQSGNPSTSQETLTSTSVPFFPEGSSAEPTKIPWVEIMQTPEQSSDNASISTTTESQSGDTTTSFTPSFGSLNVSDYSQVCGRRLYPEARVVGGEKTTFGKWPWQISLRQWRTSTYLHKCGAALLNENWAITAAHCVENVAPSDLLLRLGEHDLSTEEEPFGYQERRVQIVASHPQFDPRTFEYDLALLRFYEPVKFQPNIIPVCVPEDSTNFVGQTAHVTGWGRLYEDGPLPSVLQEVSVPVINNTICENMYRSAGYIEHIPDIFICAGWKKGGFDSCEGDSGGPMVIRRPDKRWLLAGVISWGIGCAEPNQPGVYTRISEFREWINQILQF